MPNRREERCQIWTRFGQSLLPATNQHAEDQDSATRLRSSEQSGIVDLVLDSIPESLRGPFEPPEEGGERLPFAVPNEVGDVLHEKQSRPKERHIVRHRCEDAVVPVPP